MPKKVDRCVSRVLPDLIRRYREKYGKSPSADTKKKLEQSAWAICNAQVGKSEGGD